MVCFFLSSLSSLELCVVGTLFVVAHTLIVLLYSSECFSFIVLNVLFKTKRGVADITAKLSVCLSVNGGTIQPLHFALKG